MKYKIISADEVLGQINVTYFSDKDEPVGTYSIDIPIIDGVFITGPSLEEIIQSRAPTWMLERTSAVNEASNFSEISSLVDSSYALNPPNIPAPNIVIETPVIITTTPTTFSDEKPAVTLV
jgi:hypothetical protein